MAHKRNTIQNLGEIKVAKILDFHVTYSGYTEFVSDCRIHRKPDKTHVSPGHSYNTGLDFHRISWDQAPQVSSCVQQRSIIESMEGIPHHSTQPPRKAPKGLRATAFSQFFSLHLTWPVLCISSKSLAFLQSLLVQNIRTFYIFYFISMDELIQLWT